MTKIVPTFEEFDRFQLRSFAETLVSYLETEHRFVDGALVVSLEAPFGSGKTTFFRMLEEMIKPEEGSAPHYSVVVSLNAWESDFGEDPVMAIVAGITDAIEAASVMVDADMVTRLKSAAGALLVAATSVANDVVKKQLGPDVEKVVRSFGEKPELDAGLVAFRAFQSRGKALKLLKETLSKLAEKSELKLLLLVDELDRCRPDYAVDYLESIKHVFDDENLTIVLGIDHAHLESSVKSLFGAGMKFDEYFRKFVSRRVFLPAVTKNSMGSFSGNLIERYFKAEDGSLGVFASMNNIARTSMSEVFLGLNVTPRQAHEIMRVSAHCLSCSPSKKGGMLWGWEIATIFMTALSVSRNEFFHKIGLKQITITEYASFITKLNFEKKYDDKWWLKLLLSGWITNLRDSSEELSIVLEIDSEKGENLRPFQEFGIGAYERQYYDNIAEIDPLSTIYQIIVTLGKFAR